MFVDLGETFMILQGFKGNVKMSGRFNPTELPSTISPHLKSVKVRCATVDRRVLKVLEFLSKLNTRNWGAPLARQLGLVQ